MVDIKMFDSEIWKRRVWAVPAKAIFEFENHATITYECWWADSGEFFPVDKDLSEEDIMGYIYEGEKTYRRYTIEIMGNSDVSSPIFANSYKGVITDKEVIANYIKAVKEKNKLEKNLSQNKSPIKTNKI